MRRLKREAYFPAVMTIVLHDQRNREHQLDKLTIKSENLHNPLHCYRRLCNTNIHKAILKIIPEQNPCQAIL